MRKWPFIFFFMLASSMVWADAITTTSITEEATFPGQVSRLNETAQLMRVRVEFKNAKFLNKNDRVEFWNETYPNQRCVAKVMARSNTHLLFQVPEYKTCIIKVQLTTGSTLHFWSQDLENNLKTAHELVKILQKKRMALLARKRFHQRELDGHVEKVEAVNRRLKS